MKLSICMMVKDEEKNLPRCLEKLNPLLESGIAELIIIDTGSEDCSINIAKQYTNKVYFHKWNKNFSEMRNISISYAKGEWIFIIDADERLDDSEKLIELMNSSEIDKCNTVALQVKNLCNDNDESKYNLIASPRLFKNDGQFRYKGTVHNQPVFKEPTLNAYINLTHFGYISTDKELMERKYQRTTELLKLELKKEPKNLYYIYQLGISYDMHADHKKSLNEFRKAYSILKNKSFKEKKMYAYIYVSYARIAFINNEFKETSKVSREALAFEKDFIDLYYFLGVAEKQLGNDESSVKYFNQYIYLVERYNELDISKNMSIVMYQIDDKSKSIAYFQITQYYLELGRYKEAYENYNNITSVNEIIYFSINILIPLEKYSELRKVYIRLTETKDKNSFLSTLEEKINKLEDSKKLNLYKEFSLNEDLYGLLNKVRISNNIDEKINLTKLLLKDIDFENSPVFYSEVFENVKESIKLIIDVFKGIEICNLKCIVKYLIEKKGFKEIFEDYVLENNEIIKNVEEAKVFIAIANILMLLYIKYDDNVSEKYLNIFKEYLNVGIFFVQELYKVDKAEVIYKNINNQEDRFFIIMYIVNKLIKKNNKKSAITYMIEAVNTNKSFIRYMAVYKDEIFGFEEKKIIQKPNKEFEDYKLKVKENINDLVNSGLLTEAKQLINEYEEIVKCDVDLYSIKAIILIIENKFEEAELVLKEGLNIDKNNFDLLYNLGYLYSVQNRKIEALSAYVIAKLVCDDDCYKEMIEESILRLNDKKTNIYNVILCGKTEECIGFEEILKEWNIMGYNIYGKDNGHNKKVLQINEIKNYDYDFIFILDEDNENKIQEELAKHGVKKNIYLYRNFKTSVIEGFDYRIRELLYRDDIEMLVTGSSYAEVGIKAEQLNKSTINFAFSSQDLFYDYYVVNYLLNYGNVKNSIKYVILGLSYYCFDYDISKTIAKYRIHRYINYIHNFHNNNDEIGINITKAFYEKRIEMKKYYDMNKQKRNTIIRYEDEQQEYVAKNNSIMNYNLTREENIDIFYKYLNLLKVNNIKPIIVVCPTSKYYYKYFNDGYQKNKFYKILDSFKNDFDFQVIDYFDSNLFQDKDFWDYGHLNNDGAEKFTQILNKEIIWG